MKKRAILFDLDGTLLNTLSDLADSVNHVLSERGYPLHDDAFYRHAIGEGAITLMKRSLPPDHRDDDAVMEPHDAMRAYYANAWAVKTKPYDGIPELLEALARRDMVLAVLSNKPDRELQHCVTHFFGEGRFAVSQGVLPDGPVKPDPSAALAIIEQVGIAGDAWLYVGDTNTDMQTAAAAGLYAVGCTWGFRDREELVASGADAIIDHPRELLRCLSETCRLF